MLTPATRVVDTHAHWAPPSYIAALTRLAAADALNPAWPHLMTKGEVSSPLQSLLGQMDDAGVDTSVVSIPPPGLGGLPRESVDPQHYCQANILVDNCSYHPPALDCAGATFGWDRVVLGSDYTFRGHVRRCVEDVRRSDAAARFSAEILGDNAAALLPRLLAPAGDPA